MKIALDPHMHRHLSLPETCRLTKELGYDYIELSPRPDFMVWWTRPRTYPAAVQAFKKAMREHDVRLATMQPMYRWSSPCGRFLDARTAAFHSSATRGAA